MGVYGIVRFGGWLPVPVAAAWTVVGIGATSAVLGVLFALAQHDVKRLLAYHSVENVGIILLGVGFALVAVCAGHPAWGALALGGGLLHVWNHGLFKSLLFLGAGAVVRATGTREMSRLGGLWRRMPYTAVFFTLGAVAISGLPPLNGFVSEWLLYRGLLDAAVHPTVATTGAIVAIVALAATGALALACFVKACGVVFLGAARSEAAARANECELSLRVPMGVLAACCVGIGLAPVLVWPAVSAAVGAWDASLASTSAPASLATLSAIHVGLVVLGVTAALVLFGRSRRNGWASGPTWDCGYAAPTPRMQYTAGSFAGILTGWFAGLLRPVRHVEPPVGPFPARSRHEEHPTEPVLDRVVAPLARLVLRLSGRVRRLQHGRVQSYLLYLLLGLVAVSLLALGGGR